MNIFKSVTRTHHLYGAHIEEYTNIHTHTLLDQRDIFSSKPDEQGSLALCFFIALDLLAQLYSSSFFFLLLWSSYGNQQTLTRGFHLTSNFIIWAVTKQGFCFGTTEILFWVMQGWKGGGWGGGRSWLWFKFWRIISDQKVSLQKWVRQQDQNASWYLQEQLGAFKLIQM